MIIDVSKLSYGKECIIEEDVVFNPEKFQPHFPLLEVLSTHVKIKAHRYDEFINFNVNIKSRVKVQCSYTLKPFEMNIRADEEYRFSSYESEDEEAIVYSGSRIDMDELLFNLLSASIPMAPVMPGAKLPNSGEGYEVLSEEEAKKKEEESLDPRFDALKDLEFDE